MSEWVRDAGRANWKQAFNKLRETYNGDYDKAMARWVELFPNQVPYTVTESERQTIATFGYAEQANKFITENQGIFNEFPEGAAFLIPHEGAFSFDAYKTMMDMGLLKNKRVEDYLLQVQTASDTQIYYEKKNEFEEALKTTTSDVAKRIVRQQFNNWKTQFFVGRPLVLEELSGGKEKELQRNKALNDLESLLTDQRFSNVRPDVQNSLRQMLDLYNDYQKQRDIFELTGQSSELVQAIKESTISRIKELSNFNENTRAAYDVLFSRLLD